MGVAVNDLVREFEANNNDLMDWTQSVFMDLCSCNDRATRLLNTLSYMEHIGSFKIMATQHAGTLDYSTLKHLNEEAGHAVLFKRHAERLGDGGMGYAPESLLAPASARAYFNRLEAGMVKLFGRQANYRTVYLFMSIVIEFRAVWAYGILQQALDGNGLEVSLERLLAEEQGHLYSMARRLDGDGHFSVCTIRQLWDRERALYVRLLGAIENFIAGRSLKVA